MSFSRMATPVQVGRINATIKLYTLFALIDINECEQGYCNQFCNNSVGSFICSCQDGYALESDNRTCMGKVLDLWFVPALITIVQILMNVLQIMENVDTFVLTIPGAIDVAVEVAILWRRMDHVLVSHCLDFTECSTIVIHMYTLMYIQYKCKHIHANGCT